MARWAQAGIPHKGWSCSTVIDLGEGASDDDFLELCQMCQKERIRYVHVMDHPEYDGELRVGCICAGKMSEDRVGAKAREKVLRNKAARRKKWLSRKWRTSAAGNSYLNLDGMNIGVFRKNGRWSVRIGGSFSNRSFSNEAEAKLYLFEAFWKKLNQEKDH